jgi:general stress protein 26
MSAAEPVPALDARYSSPGTVPTAWSVGRRVLEDAEVFWLVTVRPDGRPHATPLLAVWHDDALVVTTGPDERKAKNLEHRGFCLLLVGNGSMQAGLDVAVEGKAYQVDDEAVLRQIAEAYVTKYGEDWRYVVKDGGFVHAAEALRHDDPGRVLVFRIAPTTVFAFGKGEQYSQTRWSFQE